MKGSFPDKIKRVCDKMSKLACRIENLWNKAQGL